MSPHRRYGGGRESDSHRNASSRIDYTLDHQWSAVDFSASNSAPEEGTPVGRDHRNRGGDDAVQERRREALGGNRSHLGCLLDWTVEEPEPTVDPDAIGEDPAPQSPGDPTPATHTPEPGSLVLFGLGLGAALTRARRRRVAGSAEGM